MNSPAREALDRILERLHGVTGAGDQRAARCPAHDDGHASLSVGIGDDGRVLLHCHAGCTLEAIVQAIGLQITDLFADATTGHRGRASEKTQVGGGSASHPGTDSNARTPLPGLRLEEYATAKRLPVEFLRGLGLSETHVGVPSVRIPYLDANGHELAIRFRRALGGPNRFIWRRGSKPLLYGLWRLDEARRVGRVVVVEGESDTHVLWYANVPAVGLPGAATWQESWAGHLEGIETIYVMVEPDRGGTAVCEWLAKSSIRTRARLVRLGEVKDPSDLFVKDPATFRATFDAALAAGEPWIDRQRADNARAAAEALELAHDLLDDPMILDRAETFMREAGYAGDVAVPLLVFVALVSRLLERPMNLAVVAQSAAGKNRAVDAALEMMPAAAVYIVKAGSPRALIYTSADFEHRTVVVGEADSIPEEGPAATAIRNLAEDNAMAYDVVERDPKTGRFETRHVEKPGPTGLITTSTRSLGAQLGTRHLELSVPDDPAQTRLVMHAHATNVTGQRVAVPDPHPWHAVQHWLALAGARRVVVPFATILADLVPSAAVRMRRDFRQALTCVQAIALLRQRQRDRTPDGAIVATLADYAEARRLLAPIFESIVTEGITNTVRQTVEAVGLTEEVSETELGRRLGLSKATISYRVKRATRGGWLVNEETRKGCPARLRRGVPLPDKVTALPTAERVQELFERSSGSWGSGAPPAPGAGQNTRSDEAGEIVEEIIE